MNRRKLIQSGSLLALSPSLGWAQAGTAPMTWTVGYPLGAGTDVVTRAVAEAMGKVLGTSIEVTNLPGKGGALATAQAVKQPGDGKHLMTVDNGIMVYNKHIFKNLPFDAEKDLAVIGYMVRTALLIAVSPQSPFKTIQDVLKLPAAEQAKLEYASPGEGSPHHLAMEMFKQLTGLQAKHKPYRGIAAGVPDVQQGKVALMAVDAASGQAAIKSGAIKPVLSLASFPIPHLPDLPRPRDVGQGRLNIFASVGVATPASTPQVERDKLTKALVGVMSQRAMQTRMRELGWEAVAGDALMMNAYLAAERSTWAKLIKDLNLSAEF
ncbi:Bug family tripartite tricarboxylate transporter substrate binding protein [Ottowia testudinis]|uniref:Tripartite tricarboxylate transporter substrate binding protein n=1 Tax=Ottowia testudinis TaxID=2816950 RepID=A0A975CFQ4_9BURK|nr:tripartite tricarboxylate transporter substrate binding protein [Ottowia testudinis]QTD44017.1 tripartite tricarboxylate transporter substrate binding protein [Ottowia testudinis]